MPRHSQTLRPCADLKYEIDQCHASSQHQYSNTKNISVLKKRGCTFWTGFFNLIKSCLSLPCFRLHMASCFSQKSQHVLAGVARPSRSLLPSILCSLCVEHQPAGLFVPRGMPRWFPFAPMHFRLEFSPHIPMTHLFVV